MSYRIACYTLFDITQTGVLNRSKPTDNDQATWIYRRNTQCNFDTVLQVISLRSQPEVITYPVKVEMTEELFDMFGFLYQLQTETKSYCWKFEFEVQHPSVFENGIIPFGALYNDCDGVPMIVCNTQIETVLPMLNITDELKNIHFEEI